MNNTKRNGMHLLVSVKLHGTANVSITIQDAHELDCSNTKIVGSSHIGSIKYVKKNYFKS